MNLFDHFDILAPWYDRAIQFDPSGPLGKILDLPVDGNLLDAGGGTGRVSTSLLPFVRHVFVADFSHGMLAQARRKGLPALQTPAENLPFAEGSFERIIMVDALHHVHDQARTISELWRVLKPGGRLVIEEPDIRTWQVMIIAFFEKLFLMRSHFISPPDIAKLFPAASQVEIHSESNGAWIVARKS